MASVYMEFEDHAKKEAVKPRVKKSQYRKPRLKRPLKPYGADKRLPVVTGQQETLPVVTEQKSERRKVPLKQIPERVKLEESWPISPLFALLKTTPHWIGITFFWALYFGCYYGFDLAKMPTLNTLLIIGGKLWTLFALLSILYWDRFRKKFRYHVIGKHLVIERGIAFTHEVVFPITAGNYISLSQSPIESLFGMRRVHVYTSADPTRKAGVIYGLKKRVAEELSGYLLEIHGK